MNTNIIQPGTALAAALGLAIAGTPMLASAQTSSQTGSPPAPNAATQSGQMKSPYVSDDPVPKSQRWENYRSQNAGTPPPPAAATQSGQMHSPIAGDRPVPASQRWKDYRSQNAGTPPPPPGTTQSGQMHAPFVGDKPAVQSRQRGGTMEGQTPQRQTQQESSAAIVTGSSVQFAGCTETPGGAIPLSETGQPATRALNVLMASGCTRFDNFRATSGIEWAAEVPRGNGEQSVMVNPETGRIHFVRS